MVEHTTSTPLFASTPTPIPLLLPTSAATQVSTPLPGIYLSQSGDTLAALALRFDTDAASILRLNPGLPLTQTITPGLPIVWPLDVAAPTGFTTRLIPDSELVYSPAAADFDVQAFVLAQPGFLASYAEVLTYGEPARAGWEIVSLYAHRYSINPRLLPPLLEYQSHALSNDSPEYYTREHALGVSGPDMSPGLSHQLGWAGGQLNAGYYGWRAGVISDLQLADGTYQAVDRNLNAGTFALVRLLGLLNKQQAFSRAVSPEGFRATYERLFGDPFAFAIEPLSPGGLMQVEMRLPFEPGLEWAFTAGPHPVYGSTLPWGALDFGPPAEFVSCVPSAEWVVAVRDGLVTYSGDGLVELDVGEGWSVVYLHVATLDRVLTGTTVRAGDRLGHPSCEGGQADAAHLHIARKFQGEWIPADGFAPFELSGWVAHFGPMSYTGTLTKGGRVIESCPCSRSATWLWFEP
jgi:murein DD-endopeptidase MepM/ murein hydrolase activator NlpD